MCKLNSGAVFSIRFMPPDSKAEAGAVGWMRQGNHPLTAPREIIVLTRPAYPSLTPDQIKESKKEIAALIRDKVTLHAQEQTQTPTEPPS